MFFFFCQLFKDIISLTTILDGFFNEKFSNLNVYASFFNVFKFVCNVFGFFQFDYVCIYPRMSILGFILFGIYWASIF